jgi:hypothetical protein
LKLHAEQRAAVGTFSIPSIPPAEPSVQSKSEEASTPASVDKKLDPQGNLPGSAISNDLPLRPAKEQDGIHVLVVDDNEINLKVSNSNSILEYKLDSFPTLHKSPNMCSHLM